jgi:thiol-disulfide isomerase/thioredoxin
MGFEPGDKVAEFSLPNANSSVGGAELSLSEVLTDAGAIVVFECNHCPYVVGSIERIERLAQRTRDLGMGFVGINSNDAVNYPDDSFPNMEKRAAKGMSYPYLHDESQSVATEWGAERTPEFYLLDAEGVVVYRGRMDNSPSDPTKASCRDLQDALDAFSMGDKPPVERTLSIGCSIKWKF